MSMSITEILTTRKISKASVKLINNLGKLWQKGKGLYTGDFLNGNKNGKGEFEFDSGLKYYGEYYNNIKQGWGKLLNKNGKVAYEGEFKNGLPHGKGKAPNHEGELKERSWV